MRNTISVTSLIWAIALSIASLVLPPLGVIDSSVLILIAQIIVFIATVMGIKLPSRFTDYLSNGGHNK